MSIFAFDFLLSSPLQLRPQTVTSSVFMANNPTSAELSMDLRDFVPTTVRSGALASTLILSGGVAAAQDSSGSSAVADTTLEERSQEIESKPYTIKSGDFRLLIAPQVGIRYNSNVSVSTTNRQEDLILRPAIQMTATYPIGKRNLFIFDTDIGYDRYFEHPHYSAMTVVSGSRAAFDIYVEDFSINLHDRFSYTRDPGTVAAVANTAVYGGFDNTIGMSVTRDFLDFVPSVGYDHRNFIASSSQFAYQDSSSEMLNGRAGFRFNPTVMTGLEAAGSFTTYNQNILNNNAGWTGGAYTRWQPDRYLLFTMRGGYAAFHFDQTSTTLNAQDQHSYYVGITLNHDITEAVSYAVAAGHEIQLGVSSDTIEDWYARINVNWKIIKGLIFTTELSYENGTQGATTAAATTEEHFNWITGNVGLSHPITKNLQANLDYRFTTRTSNLSNRDYTQNLIGFRLTYLFK